MSARMESKQRTQSVIAKLMGLDDLPPQQPVQKRQRVLSENYLRRVASIGVIEKRPFYERHSFRLSLEEQREFKDVFEVSETLKMGKGKADSNLSDSKMEYVSQDFINAKCISMDIKLQTSKEFHDALGVIDSEKDQFLKYLQEPDSLLAKHLHDLQGVPTQPQSSHITVLKSVSASDYRKIDICKKPGRRRNQRNAKSLQKVENGLITDSHGEFGLDNIHNFSRSRLESNDEACFPYTKIVVLQPNHGKLENAARYFSSSKTRTNHKAPHNDRYMGPLQHMSRKQVPKQKDGLQSRNSGSSCMKFQSISCLESKNNYLVENDDVIKNDLKRKLEEKNPYKQNSMVSMSSSYSGFGSGSLNDCTIQESWVLPNEQKNNIKERDLSEQNSLLPLSSVSSVAAVSIVSERVADSETEVVGRYSGNHKDQQFEPTDCILLLKDDDASQIQDNLIQQDISTGISEEGSVSSFCSGTDPESLMNLEEAYHPSPVSVLEPLFKEEISSDAEFFCSVNADLHGLQKRLEFLKSEPSESYSEGPGMIVSSDEETEEGSEGNSKENEDIMRSFKVEESRDFSYIVDVLHEAGFHSRKPDMGFNTWNSPECAINALVFEKLEKKYGEQTTWKRSERRLLFDRINLGLMEILQPYTGTPASAKPVLRRLSFRQSLEEELWMLLVSLEKEASKYLSDQKVLGQDGKWLELGYYIEVIGQEIESSLIDELAAEVSMESI